MTFEQIMEIFKDHFEIDKDIEVVNFRHGYQIFVWGEKQNKYIPDAELITTREELFESILDEIERFYELKYHELESGKLCDESKNKINAIINRYKNAAKKYKISRFCLLTCQNRLMHLVY